MCTKIARALPLTDQFNRSATTPAGQVFTSINHRLELEMTGLPLRIGKIAQRAPPQLQGIGQYLLDRLVQAFGSCQAQLASWRRGSNACSKQSFGCINIAHPYHQFAGQQHLFDRCSAFLQALPKFFRRKLLRQRLRAQMRQQFLCGGAGFGAGIHHGAKPARIVQSQHSLRGQQVKVIMHACSYWHWQKCQTTRHAQMQQK